MLRGALLVFGMLVSAVGITSAETISVGYIQDYRGSAANYVLERFGQRVPVEYFTPLFSGDVVRNEMPNGEIWLRIGTREVHIDKSIPRYEVRERPTSGQAVTNFMREFGRVLTRSKDGPRATAITRETTLRLKNPGIGDGSALVVRGTRLLGVAWEGGRGPYCATISAASGLRLVWKCGVTDLQLIDEGPTATLSSGKYLVSVTDSQQVTVIGSFSAVASSEIPAPPPGIIPLDASDDTKIVLNAAWLVQQDLRRFGFEAYLQLLPILKTRPEAEGAAIVGQSVGAPRREQ